jgi:outer membrane protein assembly factor BamB
LVLLLLGVTAVGQQPDPAGIRGESSQTRKRLAEAEQKLLAGKAADAIDDLQRILDEAGDDLISLDGKQYRAARWFAHQILAQLPAEVLQNYQDQLDVPARKLLDTAKKTRNPASLRQLLDRYFVSRPADEALLLLGDLLFEQGEFRAAELQWRRLLPDGKADLTYPRSKADPAAVRARIILAMLFRGDVELATEELAAFKAAHAQARGTLAGQEGLLVDILQSYVNTTPQVATAGNSGDAWPMLGGSPDRSGRIASRIPAYWPAKPTWIGKLDPEPFRSGPSLPPARPPFGHPVIVNGQVVVTDGHRVFSFDLLSGKRLIDFTPLQPPQTTPNGPSRDTSPALTAAGDRLYLRLGISAIRPPNPAKMGRPGEESAIVCLMQVAKADGSPGLREVWRLRPPVGDGKASVIWEGAPLVAERRLWAAYSRFEGGRLVHGIACYDPADSLVAPSRPAWVVDVSDSPVSLSTEGRTRHELLTLAGRNVVFCSNDGVVTALDAATGRRTWAFRYPRSKKNEPVTSSEPAPVVAVGGRVFVAPTDGERVYALDAETGQQLWESGPAEGVQILGVAAGRLIITVAGPVRGIRGLNVATGSYRPPEGWIQHDGGGYLSYGRGFVTDEVIVWPTRNGLFFLRPEDGSRLWTGHANGTPFGHVVYADGVLVVVTPTQVWGYVSDRKRFGDPRADGDTTWKRFAALIASADQALAAGATDRARQILRAATHRDFPVSLRAWAAARLLLLTPKVSSPAQLPTDLQEILVPELLQEWLIPPDGIPIKFQTLLERHLGRDSSSPFTPPSLPATSLLASEPSLDADSVIVRTIRLPAGTAPLRWLPGARSPRQVVLTTTQHLIAIRMENGTETRYDAIDRFTHAADLTEGFVVAGPWAVAVYGSDRSPVWVFRVPTAPPLRSTGEEFRVYSDDTPPIEELSSFYLNGSWLIARFGERHLIALDLRGKRVAWVLGTSGTLGYRPVGFPDAPRFGPELFVSSRLTVVQLSNGCRWFLRTDTGRRQEITGLDHPTAKVWWSLPPAEVEANRLAVSDGPGLVRMLNLVTGRVKWTRHEDGLTSLTGEPPQVRAWHDLSLIAVSRNHGVELDRLDMSDGTSMWKTGPAFVDSDRIDLSKVDADRLHIYVPQGNKLVAYTHQTGRSEWTSPLPPIHGAGQWVVRTGARCVIVYPEAAIPREPVAEVLSRLVRTLRTGPALLRLPGLLAGLYDAWVTRTVPVLLFDPETGKQLTQFEIPAAGPAVTAWFDRDLAVVATGSRVVWLR